MTQYQKRIVDQELDEISALPAIALEGAKGVGKTATASQRANTIHDLDDPAYRIIAEADPQRLLLGDPPVLIDEWQHIPSVWDYVRRAVDAGSRSGQYFLTGSTYPRERPAHSGAGRIVSIRMRPLSLPERGIEIPSVSLSELLTGNRPPISGKTAITLDGYANEIVNSGFPGVRKFTGRVLRTQLDGYLRRVVEKDFPDMGLLVRNPSLLHRWMTAYAAATSTTATYEKIRDAATSGEDEKPAKTTVQTYRDLLEQVWLIEPVPGWLPTRRRINKLTVPPKHQFVDPALAARLLNVGVDALLTGAGPQPAVVRDGSLLGALFESLITLNVRVFAQNAEARVAHLRTKGGDHEIDLIVEGAEGRVLAIEVKLGATVKDNDATHLNWLDQQLGDDLLDKVIITTGPEAYRRRDGVAVVPASLLGP